MDPSRRSLLLSSAAAAALGLTARAGGPSPGRPRHLVVVFADGGWDVTFAMDPKPRDEGGLVDGPWVDEPPDHPTDREYLEVIHGIPVQCNDHKRPAVGAFFRTWGARCCVINGIWTGSIVHQPSRIRILTGTPQPSSPDFATVVGVERSRVEDLPLATVDFSGLGYTGPFAAKSGRIGHAAQLKALLDPTTTFPAPPGAGYTLPISVPSPLEEAALSAHLADRVAAMRERYGGSAPNDARLDAMLESYERRDRLLAEGRVLTDPLTLGTRPDLALQADLAVELLRAGLCHTLTLAEDGPVWDTHDANHLQHERYQLFFSAANRLVDGLRRADLLDETLVVLMSEMTRTPRRNWKTGKDHWSHTSMIWVGGGVQGGTVVGGTNASVESEPIDLTTGEISAAGVLNKYDNVAAGILAHMGVDPEAYLPGVPPLTAATRS
ncbi:MAG TPA: DUF1501 domain-containing protein [Deltaproteobacteria bacterium]|nr:DUF1501 domain-containing protein [Deltaproteobacteria bacterium]